MTTVGDALVAARSLGVDRLDAQCLLAHHLRRPRSWLLTHDDDALLPDLARRFDADCRRRLAGEPLAYVMGSWSFRDLPLAVSDAVLVPRPETEGLVDWALEVLAGALADRAGPEVADLGTGSGAIALAIARDCPRARVTATDASPAALAVARANGNALRLPVRWCLGSQGDWWQPLGGATFDLLVSNPPYVAEGDPHLDALRHEPVSALVAGSDGLEDLRQLCAGAARHLRPGAWLLLEHGHDQGEAVRQALTAGGLVDVSTRRDLAGLDRCSWGRRA